MPCRSHFPRPVQPLSVVMFGFGLVRPHMAVVSARRIRRLAPEAMSGSCRAA